MNWTVAKLEALGRKRLSTNFCMREMLYSEIAQVNGMVNAPVDVDLAIYAGNQLCESVLEPIMQAWGKIIVRSAYRSEEVNAWGNANKANCASNERNYAAHIWDRRDAGGYAGATASIVIPRYLDYYEQTGDWASLAWWVHHHIGAYHELVFFPKQCAFNIRWYENSAAVQSIKTFAVNPHTGDKSVLLKKGTVHSHYAAMAPEERFGPCVTLLSSTHKAATPLLKPQHGSKTEDASTASAGAETQGAAQAHQPEVTHTKPPENDPIPIASNTDESNWWRERARKWRLSPTPNANGLMMKAKGKTVFTVYFSSLSQDFVIEVAYNQNLSLLDSDFFNAITPRYSTAATRPPMHWPRIGVTASKLNAFKAEIEKHFG